MAAKREQLRAWIGARPGIAGADLGVRMRSTVFALLGLTTASCLVLVAILVHQGVPVLPSLPLPGLGGGDERVAAAEPVGGAPSVVSAASDRLASADPTLRGGVGGAQGGSGATEPAKAVPPGPSSAVAPSPSEGPIAAPVPVPEPTTGGGGAPATPAPSPAPVSAAPTDSSTSSSSPTDTQTSKGKSGKSSSSSSRGEGGTDAPAPKKSSQAPVSTPEAPPMTDAEPEPATDTDLDNGKGRDHWK